MIKVSPWHNHRRRSSRAWGLPQFLISFNHFIPKSHLGAEVGAMIGVLGVLDDLRCKPPVCEGRFVGVGAPASGGARELGAVKRFLEVVQGPAGLHSRVLAQQGPDS